MKSSASMFIPEFVPMCLEEGPLGSHQTNFTIFILEKRTSLHNKEGPCIAIKCSFLVCVFR